MNRRTLAILALTVAAFAGLFAAPLAGMVPQWWSDPEAGAGLLLAPVAFWLAWRSRPSGSVPPAPSRTLGLLILLAAILLRYLAALAVESFTMRVSAVLALIGITAYYLGLKQVRVWWLPIALLLLAIPLPEVVRASLTLPLQLKASQVGAALLEWRDIPVRLSGNIIEVPGRRLFVSEACSGLRSLTALVSLSVLFGAILLRSWVGRGALLAGAIAVAIGMNAVRVFLTGFLVVYGDPALADGFLHLSEGFALFLISLALTAAWGMMLKRVERWRRWPRVPAAAALEAHP